MHSISFNIADVEPFCILERRMKTWLGSPILNFVLFQGCWLACARGEGWGYPWLGPLAVLLFLGVESLRCPPRVLWGLAVGAAGLGLGLDQGLVWLGALDFSQSEALKLLDTPVWMVALWANFAAALLGSLSWLGKRYGLGAVMGLVGGPLAYYAGAELGALVLVAPLWQALLWVGLEWALAMPLLMWLRGWLEARTVTV